MTTNNKDCDDQNSPIYKLTIFVNQQQHDKIMEWSAKSENSPPWVHLYHHGDSQKEYTLIKQKLLTMDDMQHPYTIQIE